MVKVERSGNGTSIYYIDDKEPTLELLQKLVDGNIEIAYDDGELQMICNEEGKMQSLPLNYGATAIWEEKLRKFYSNPAYVMKDILVGNIVICSGKGKLR
jgi:hypothetical protein|tara:strand:- start:90 stop:389 length:300 start_codon:yes stop_codon:yes gene_type:complete